jgi:hypothetical protein
MGLIEQSEGSAISMKQNDGNRLRVLEQRERSVVTPFDETVLNSGIVSPYASGFAQTCWWRIPPDITEGRVYIISTAHTAASFAVYCFPEYTEGVSTPKYVHSSAITMGGSVYKTALLTGLVGCEAIGLEYLNGSGSSTDITVRFVCETAYPGIS